MSQKLKLKENKIKSLKFFVSNNKYDFFGNFIVFIKIVSKNRFFKTRIDTHDILDYFFNSHFKFYFNMENFLNFEHVIGLLLVKKRLFLFLNAIFQNLNLNK